MGELTRSKEEKVHALFDLGNGRTELKYVLPSDVEGLENVEIIGKEKEEEPNEDD